MQWALTTNRCVNVCNGQTTNRGVITGDVCNGQTTNRCGITGDVRNWQATNRCVNVCNGQTTNRCVITSDVRNGQTTDRCVITGGACCQREDDDDRWVRGEATLVLSKEVTPSWAPSESLRSYDTPDF